MSEAKSRDDPKISKLNLSNARNKREKESVHLRKQARELSLSKRRMKIQNTICIENTVNFIEKIEFHRNQIVSDDPRLIEESLEFFEQILSQNNPPISEIIECGIVEILINITKTHPSVKINMSCLSIFTNIAAGDRSHINYLINLNVHQILFEKLKSEVADIRTLSLWTLGNLVGDSAEIRDLLLSNNYLNTILSILRTEKDRNVFRMACWVISNFCRNRPLLEKKYSDHIVPVACELLYNSDVKVVFEALNALSFLSEINIRQLLDNTVCPRAIFFLRSDDENLIIPAIRIVGNLMSSEDDSLTQKVIDHDVLKVLVPLLRHRSNFIRKEACWALSNVLSGPQSQIECVFEENAFPEIFNLVYEPRLDIKKEAAWCLGNTIVGARSNQIIRILRSFNVIEAIISIIKDLDSEKDLEIMEMMLESIYRLLVVGKYLPDSNLVLQLFLKLDGVNLLEQLLQVVCSSRIWDQCKKILNKFFADNESNEYDSEDNFKDFLWDPNTLSSSSSMATTFREKYTSFK